MNFIYTDRGISRDCLFNLSTEVFRTTNILNLSESDYLIFSFLVLLMNSCYCLKRVNWCYLQTKTVTTGVEFQLDWLLNSPQGLVDQPSMCLGGSERHGLGSMSGSLTLPF